MIQQKMRNVRIVIFCYYAIMLLCMGGCSHYRLNGMERCSEYKYSLDKEIIKNYMMKR